MSCLESEPIMCLGTVSLVDHPRYGPQPFSGHPKEQNCIRAIDMAPQLSHSAVAYDNA